MKHIFGKKPAIVALLAVMTLSSCSGFQDLEEIPQADLQKEAIWPDQAISVDNCPVVVNGFADATAMPSINGKWGCGSEAPFSVVALMGGNPVQFDREATINCVMTSQLYRYFSEIVQPLALDKFGQPVAEIRVAASYACRPRNNKSGAKLSEHGRANAIDISAFVLRDGTVLTVEDDWARRGRKGRFLRAINRQACRYFTTVIGPGGDKYHQDHIHLDHGLHGKNGVWRVCQ
nr:extensin family protein [uncultured Cohaesibacter sp.]